jgi:dTDP-4-dehydrorhamnose reductase
MALLAVVRSGKGGLFHTAGATPLSRFEFSVRLANRLSLDESLVLPISSSKLKQVAKRPSNSSLVSGRIKREVGYGMMPIDEALDLFAGQAMRGVHREGFPAGEK